MEELPGNPVRLHLGSGEGSWGREEGEGGTSPLEACRLGNSSMPILLGSVLLHQQKEGPQVLMLHDGLVQISSAFFPLK